MELVEVKKFKANIGPEIFNVFPQGHTYDIETMKGSNPEEEALATQIKGCPADNKWHVFTYKGKAVPVHKRPDASAIFAQEMTDNSGNPFWGCICF